MSWHKEFLSENKNTNKISKLSDLYTLIEEVYETKKGNLFGSLAIDFRALKEQFLVERKDLSLTLQAIPEISVTELGWTDVRTTGGQRVSGPERQMLGQFLSQVEGANIKEKVASLSRFYQDGPGALGDMSTGKKISKILSYLVFFKALTKVVSNFNAASAGFNFEAFLAVLLDGSQIAANTGTIADFKTGDEVPISLKLYNEKSVVVGGSFNDLVGDLVNPQFSGFDGMRYLVCMKSFRSSETGELQGSGLDIEGDIKFYQFDFTLDNIADIIFDSMAKSKICFQLPREFIATRGRVDVSKKLPGANLPSPQELEVKFIDNFYSILEKELSSYRPRVNFDRATFEPFIDALEWSKRDSIFSAVEKGEERRVVLRGQSSILGKTRNKEVYNIALALAEDDKIPLLNDAGRLALQPRQIAKELRHCVVKATEVVNSEFKAARVKSEREKILKGVNFYASLGESVKFYNSIPAENPELRKMALLNTRGMLETYQFDLNRAQVVEISEDLGAIRIGAKVVQEMLNNMSSELNQAIFEIFTNVKTVQENTYSFMAGGLRDDAAAQRSINASNAISEKTQELRDASPSDQLNLSFQKDT